MQARYHSDPLLCYTRDCFVECHCWIIIQGKWHVFYIRKYPPFVQGPPTPPFGLHFFLTQASLGQGWVHTYIYEYIYIYIYVNIYICVCVCVKVNTSPAEGQTAANLATKLLLKYGKQKIEVARVGMNWHMHLFAPKKKECNPPSRSLAIFWVKTRL
jgi:hypothetical protein